MRLEEKMGLYGFITSRSPTLEQSHMEISRSRIERVPLFIQSRHFVVTINVTIMERGTVLLSADVNECDALLQRYTFFDHLHSLIQSLRSIGTIQHAV